MEKETREIIMKLADAIADIMDRECKNSGHNWIMRFIDDLNHLSSRPN